MTYQISLYYLVPWQRITTLIKQSFDVDTQQKGISNLWYHLKNSANREIRTERLEDNNVVDLVRPIDCEYTISWIFTTKHIKDSDKAKFAQVLIQMSSDRWLWFGFRKVRN